LSDTSPRDQAALRFDAKRKAARMPKPGEEVWRVRHADGRVQSCELRDNSLVHAGWDVMVLQNDEPLFSRRCPDEGTARFVAASVKQDLLRTGWADDAAVREATEP